jgi:gliding motility-associated-like protein
MDMKRLFLILVVASMALFSKESIAQNLMLNANTHETTVNRCAGYFYDNSSTADYATSVDRWVTICPTSGNPNTRIALTFEEFNIGAGDYVKIYEGTSINDPEYMHVEQSTTFSGNDLQGATIMPSLTIGSQCLTFRLVSDGSGTASGWKAVMECVQNCQFPEADLDTFFYKYDSEGNMTTRPVRELIDTVVQEDGSEVYVPFKAIDICLGDSVVLVAKPKFPEYIPGEITSYYQGPENCIYYWSFGDGTGDTVNFDPTIGHGYPELNGYDIMLTVEDTNNGGCKSRNTIDTRLRIATNPIKTVAPIPDICSGTELGLNVGYGANSSIIVDSLDFSRSAKETYINTVFIPDGPNCTYINGTMCFDAPVVFDAFTPGAVVGSSDDIMSICLNAEHSYIGDIGMQVICPNGQSVILKNQGGGGGIWLGVTVDEPYNSSCCDTSCAPQGEGWTYCWSNQYLDGARGVLGTTGTSGQPLDSTNTVDTTGYFQTPVQGSGTTVDLTAFNNLIGCPLNGEWIFRICDNLSVDNGFIYYWDLELGQNSGANWDYQVPLDTVIWEGVSFYTPTSPTSATIAPPIDSAGTFIFNITVIDDFGCQWDTISPLTVVQTPVVDLGEDVALCEMYSVELDAGNESPTASYAWAPTGDTTRVITAQTHANSNSVIKYEVLVTEYNGSIYCYGRDSINLLVHPAAIAAFTSDKFPLEGCEPYSFQLQNTATNAQTFEWHVGEESSTEPNPSFTFPYGTYDIKLKVTSEHGCTDSIEYNDIINVYRHPAANFGWEPNNPYASNPTADLINLTEPNDATNQYHWTIQTNKNDANAIENVFGANPSYTWTPQSGETVAGDYTIVLDAYSVNLAPSGYIYECHDTISRIITIINDNLMFPNVITPNGDGINDVFEIHNLIDGQAFPDNELSIYNRYGKRIFFIQNMRNESDFWDPAATNTPSGTYFYRFIGRGPIRDVEYKGSIEVLR